MFAEMLKIPCLQLELISNMSVYGDSIAEMNLVNLQTVSDEDHIICILEILGHEPRTG